MNSFETARQPGAIPPSGPAEVTLRYRRARGDYDGWGLHVWGPTLENVTWRSPLRPAGQDSFGVYWTVRMAPGAQGLHFIIHKGDEKDPGPDQLLALDGGELEIWLAQGTGRQFADPLSASEWLFHHMVADLHHKARAHWLRRDKLAWPVQAGPGAVFRLHHHPEGALQATPQGLENGSAIELQAPGTALQPELAARFPHLAGALALQLPEVRLADVPDLLKGQLAVSVSDAAGNLLEATALQLPGVLDDLYPCDRELGVVWQRDVPTLRVWAPTARAVSLVLFPDSAPGSQGQRLPMAWEPDSGTWSLVGEPGWKNRYYLYEIDVYVRQEGRLVRNLVTDPYSVSLAVNGTRSQIVDLADPALMPEGWLEHRPPPLSSPQDIVLYELHVRDFSAWDTSLPPGWRGKYLAFTHAEGAGMRHLKRLAQAGVTHVHLMPVFDFATVDEDPATWAQPDYEALTALPPDSPEQQAYLAPTRGRDGYNWGYDPKHYGVPQGSYATDPDGPARILEFRRMVMALHQAGLRVVLDVVYNHTHAAGQSEGAVLDRVTPGYYHRLNAEGRLESSTCCADTASEHSMMEHLMRATLRRWAREYRVDGFRFDLMGHHLRANMERVQADLSALTLAADGVEGSEIYLYGEGWDFGGLAGGARGINASQGRMAGTGIGTFNDRLRDAARGGGPFGGMRQQGFINGLHLDPNEDEVQSPDERLAGLLARQDLIRVSLAGNLAAFRLTGAEGRVVTGAELGFNGQPAGYTAGPLENVLYVSAHDNETLFDAVQYKAPLETPMQARVRMHNLGVSLVALGQGVPFFHAGVELLRSKSLDRDSYNSGDWFNRLDYTYQDNNWGAGLPPEEKNSHNWPLMRMLLARPDFRPEPAHIQAALQHFEEMLLIRKSSLLFRLRSAAAVLAQVRFHNTGPGQRPGLIAMSLVDDPEAPADPRYDLIAVLFNAAPQSTRIVLPELAGKGLSLHPVLAQSNDPVVRSAHFESKDGSFAIPGRTTAVFVQRKG